RGRSADTRGRYLAGRGARPSSARAARGRPRTRGTTRGPNGCGRRRREFVRDWKARGCPMGTLATEETAVSQLSLSPLPLIEEKKWTRLRTLTYQLVDVNRLEMLRYQGIVADPTDSIAPRSTMMGDHESV